MGTNEAPTTRGQRQAAYMRTYRKENAERLREYFKRYRATRSPATLFAWESNKRAKRAGVEGRLRGSDIPAFGPCVYCGRDEEPVGWDHVIPLSRGGANDPSNLVRCCKHCNDRKCARTPEEFADEVAAEARRQRKLAYVRQWHREHYAELYAKRKARREANGHW